MNEKKTVAEIIKNNPGCSIFIDNDYWQISDANEERIASSNEYQDLGCVYGLGILEALCDMLNIAVEYA